MNVNGNRLDHVISIVGLLLFSLVILLPVANADTWRGRAPFCSGRCLEGEQEIGRNKCGNGACCLTGSKALCRNSAPTCQSLQTNVACKGVALICDNGFYTQSTDQPSWNSCSKHACGVCFGWWSDWKEPVKGTAEGVISILSMPSLPINGNANLPNLPYGPDTCKQGFVWRDAIQVDHVCVRPESRTRAANDNSSAMDRREPNGGAYGPDTCKQGFVWREVVPSDHVCVTPEVREQTKVENSQFDQNRARGSLW